MLPRNEAEPIKLSPTLIDSIKASIAQEGASLIDESLIGITVNILGGGDLDGNLRVQELIWENIRGKRRWPKTAPERWVDMNDMFPLHWSRFINKSLVLLDHGHKRLNIENVPPDGIRISPKLATIREYDIAELTVFKAISERRATFIKLAFFKE